MLAPSFVVRLASRVEYGESERRYHTRLGWWVMTHDRGGAILIGLVASLILAIDLALIAVRWDKFSPLSFAVGFVSLAVFGVAARLLGAGAPVGADRVEARRRAGYSKAVFAALLFAVLGGARLVGLSNFSFLAGLVAALAVMFIAVTARWLR